MKKIFISSFGLPIFLSIIISLFCIPIISIPNSNISYISNTTYNSYAWPTRGYTNVTSKFGYRKVPVTGASSYHGGIDIGAPQGSNICAIADGIVSYVGWYGANGYSIIVSHENGLTSTYGHLSDTFIVSVGDIIKKGQIIAQVGPKYITEKSYTTYIDETGKFTNGATTGPHLHLAISKNGKRIDPLTILNSKHF